MRRYLAPRSKFGTVAALWLLAAVATGCDPLELTTPSEVVRLRVLAIEAQPAELAFGDAVTLTPVIADPWSEGYSIQWMPCVEAQLAGFVACDFENMLVDPTDPFSFASLSQEELAFTVDQQVVLDLLAGRDPLDRAEGVALQFILMLLPRGKTFFDYMPEFDVNRLDDEAYLAEYEAQAAEAMNEVFEALIRQSRIAYKRVIVSDPDSVGIALHDDGECAELPGLVRNQAPELAGLVAIEDGAETAHAAGARFAVPLGDTLQLRPMWNPAEREAYYHVAWDGATECRSENPFFGWFATEGSFQDTDGMPTDYSFLDAEGRPSSVSWKAPSSDPHHDPVDAWLTVWDRRGGIHHLEFEIDLVPATGD